LGLTSKRTRITKAVTAQGNQRRQLLRSLSGTIQETSDHSAKRITLQSIGKAHRMFQTHEHFDGLVGMST
jgi:hypothetical protein